MPIFPVKRMVRSGFRSLGYRVTKLGPPNRFQSMEEALRHLRSQGYSPRRVIDCGANVGTWTGLAHLIFREAEFHLIEPQTGCFHALQRMASRTPGLQVHSIAVTRPGLSFVQLIGGGTESCGTGARVAGPHESGDDAIECPASTLDELFVGKVSSEERVLLKLDLEGHEIEALLGAARVLTVIEVILTEIRFFDIEKSGCPIFSDILQFLTEYHFTLYDFASLLGRSRDTRLRLGDAIFVRNGSPLLEDTSWE